MLFGYAHSVESGLEAVITPILQGIPNVDGDGACHRVTWLLQPCLYGLFGCGALPSTHLQTHLPYQTHTHCARQYFLKGCDLSGTLSLPHHQG